MEPNIVDVARRIRSLREDMEFTTEEMAQATGRSVEEYETMESGESDFSFTFLYRCADKLGVDMVDLLTGETPHLTGYTVVRAGKGLSIKRRAGFEYRHLAANFRDKESEPFFVSAPYIPGEEDKPIHLSKHAGQEFDYILRGSLRFAYEDHVEDLHAGDSVYYDSGRGHGMVAIGGQPCEFLAIVLRDDSEIDTDDAPGEGSEV